MITKTLLTAAWGFVWAVASLGLSYAQLTSPVPGVNAKPTGKAAAPAPGAAAASAPALGGMDGVGKPGSGAGTHGANSPFAPLKPRDDVVPWAVLADIKTKTEKNKIVPVFTASQLGLNQKTQRIQGFMMPLEPGEKQRHFILSSVPLSCSFCLPGGPESLVEVKTKEPVKYSMEAVVVEGRFTVLTDDPYGVYYRVTDAVAVK